MANEWHQRVVNNEKMDINMAIFLKRLAFQRYGVKTREKADMRSIAYSPAGYSAHASCPFFAGACATPHRLYDILNG